MVDERVPAENECCEAVTSSVLRVMLQNTCVLIHAYLMFSFMSVGGLFLGNMSPHGCHLIQPSHFTDGKTEV